MVNKLQTVSLLAGGVIVALSVYGVIKYQNPYGFLDTLLFGLIVATLPWIIAYIKLGIHQAYWALKNRRSTSAEHGSIFVSTDEVPDHESTLADIESALRTRVSEGTVSPDQFAEGPGLTVTFAGFHNSFIRIDRKNRVVVTGASRKVKELKDSIESAEILSFKQSNINPFVRPMPVTGGVRIFLAAGIILMAIGGIAGVSETAYPADVYNPGEKTVLLGFDVWSAMDPTKSAPQGHLDKAAFYVAVLEEEAIEISWDNPNQASVHAAAAFQTSEDAREELATARELGLTQPQAERADQIEQQLHAAERDVADALEQKVAEDAPPDRGEVLSDASSLREVANQTA